jgi:hypothetical protein
VLEHNAILVVRGTDLRRCAVYGMNTNISTDYHIHFPWPRAAETCHCMKKWTKLYFDTLSDTLQMWTVLSVNKCKTVINCGILMQFCQTNELVRVMMIHLLQLKAKA